jgi:ribonuclease P protein component
MVIDQPQPRGLPGAARLKRPIDFKAVYAARQSVASGPLVFYGRQRTDSGAPTRLGLSVSRRVGNAVVRNRWKRRLREAFRLLRQDLPAGFDLVVIVRASGPPEAGAPAARRIEQLMRDGVARLVNKMKRAAGQTGLRSD